MTSADKRRNRRFIDGLAGGVLTFVLELGLVVGLGLVAYLVAFIVLI